MTKQFLRGQIALPFILLISGIMIEITIGGSFLAYFLSTGGLGERLSARAFAAAQAGIDDALIKVVRDKEFAATTVNYNLSVEDDSVALAVSRTSDNSAGVYIYTITATATASSRQRKFVAMVVVSQTTGEVKFQSLAEQPVS